MRVLFIYPDLNIDLRWRGQYSGAVASLSAVLKSKGHYVELAHVYNLAKGKDIIKQISTGCFDLVAFSSTTTMFPFVQYCSKTIKERFKNIPLLYGGAHPTCAPAESLNNSGVDYVCVGEGEYFILDFLEFLKGFRSKAEVKNLAYRKGTGEIVINELRPPIDPLDELPFPDRELFDLQHRTANVAYVSAGRGCPYRCAYCSNDHLNKIYKNKYLRFRKPETVISEIKLLLRKYPSIRELSFLDDVFILDEDRLSVFCKLYGNLFHVPFFALAHPATITEKKIRILKEAGCNKVGFGVQSGNEFIRNNVVLRGVSNNKIKESIRILKKYKMSFAVDVIFGIPLEQKTHMLDTVKICAENKVRVKSHIFYPLPATRLEQIAIENGLFDRNIYGEDYHSKTILKYSKLHKARILFFHRYVNHIVSIYRKFAYSKTFLFSNNARLYMLDKILCSDFVIYSIMVMRSGYIGLRSFVRKMHGISEYRLTQLREVKR